MLLEAPNAVPVRARKTKAIAAIQLLLEFLIPSRALKDALLFVWLLERA
jgi:hypothetical protein